MVAIQHHRIVVGSALAADPCAHCDARELSVCNAIDAHDLARLAAIAQPLEIPRGRVFIEDGESAEHFFNITGGTARLYKLMPDGRRQITGFATVGHFLGLAVQRVYTFSAEAIDPVRLCRFSRTRLRELLDDFPALEKRLLESATNELVVAQEQMLLLGRKTAHERVASFLVTQSTAGRPCGAARRTIHLAMTRTDIADYLGLTIETVSRTFSRLKAESLIALPSGTEVVVLDRDRLEGLAEGIG